MVWQLEDAWEKAVQEMPGDFRTVENAPLLIEQDHSLRQLRLGLSGQRQGYGRMIVLRIFERLLEMGK